MATLILPLVLLACGPKADPELDPLGRAVAAADRGEAAFAGHDLPAARAAFADALAARPDDALLHAWAGRVADAAGDGPAARAELDRAIALSPAFGQAHLLRARLRARAGEAAGAAEDVKMALRAGAITPRGVLRDAELAALASTPPFDFLPPSALEARLGVPTATAFLGSEVEIALDVVGVGPGPVEIAAAGAGPVALVRVTEDERTGVDGDRVRELRWTLRVEGAGDVVVGPIEVRQGTLGATAPAATFHAEAPPGRSAPATPLRLPTPAGVVGDRAVPAAWRDGGFTWVALPPGGRVEADVPARELPWALRRDGEPEVDLQRLPDDVGHLRVRGADGAVVWDGAPSPG